MHAYSDSADQIDVAVKVSRRGVYIETHDRGSEFSPDDVSFPDLDAIQIHGYGLFLMQELLDDVSYSRQKNGVNVWQLKKNW